MWKQENKNGLWSISRKLPADVLFLLSDILGGFVVGIFLGYLWIQLRLLGKAVLIQLKNMSSEKHVQVFTYPQFKKNTLVGRRTARAGKHISRKTLWVHAV